MLSEPTSANRGRAYQPSFSISQVIRAWLGVLLAITLLGLLST